jgi:hypothetical protein
VQKAKYGRKNISKLLEISSNKNIGFFLERERVGKSIKQDVNIKEVIYNIPFSCFRGRINVKSEIPLSSSFIS